MTSSKTYRELTTSSLTDTEAAEVLAHNAACREVGMGSKDVSDIRDYSDRLTKALRLATGLDPLPAPHAWGPQGPATRQEWADEARELAARLADLCRSL